MSGETRNRDMIEARAKVAAAADRLYAANLREMCAVLISLPPEETLRLHKEVMDNMDTARAAFREIVHDVFDGLEGGGDAENR